jgi:hypothetical protein
MISSVPRGGKSDAKHSAQNKINTVSRCSFAIVLEARGIVAASGNAIVEFTAN